MGPGGWKSSSLSHRGVLAKRLSPLVTASFLGREVPVAGTAWTRLMGLAFLDREEVGEGLLLPRCQSVHTLGMRFPLDVFFLDAAGEVIDARLRVPAGRFAACRGAEAVLELPSR
jgi:uncharacterized protein